MTSPFAGRNVGNYRIVEQLGHGMSMVFKAVNIETNQVAALKMIFLGNIDGRELAEVEGRGADIQRQLSKEGAPVPAFYKSGEADGYFYVAMEYIEGEDLTELIGRGLLDAQNATRIAIDICEFLEKAQSFVGAVDGKQAQGIAHGDLKPGNIRIRWDRAIILDLGIAKALSGKSTKNDFVSIAYSSPERLRTGKMNSLSDLWSAGVVLYEMVVGRRPFNADDTGKLERVIQSYRPVELPLNCNVPEGLRRIILKALAPNIEMRYASATAFKDDLLRFKRGARTLAEDDDDYDYEVPTSRFNDEPPPTGRTFAARVGGSYEAWPESDDEATRRTIQPSPAAKSPANLETKPMEQSSKPSALRLVKLILIGVVILVTVGLFANEMIVLSAATKLKDELISEQLKDLNQAWNRFESLDDRSILRFGPRPARQPLKEKLIAQADRVFDDYRHHGSPAVKEKDWQTAQAHLSNALKIEADNVVKSKLRSAEGHVHRINGMALLKDGNRQEARNRFNKAVNLFLEATALNPQWPDPHLALASIFAYDLHDPTKVANEIEQLKKLKVTTGDREIAMLADAYLRMGNDLNSRVDQVKDCNQKIEVYGQCREAYTNAIEHYKTIFRFGDAAKSLNLAQTRVNLIDQKLEALEESCP